jgi:predicted Zn finger-like uncharacterized protein
MFTVCPKCTLTLAVTAADLRTGQGYVRCGRCLNVFNALLALSEEPAEKSAAAPGYSQADPASSSQISAALASSANDPGESDHAPEPRVHLAGDAAPRTYLATERSSDGAIENESSLAEGTGSFETIVLEGDAITQTEEFVPEESIDSEIAALTERLNEAAHQPVQSAADFDYGYHADSAAVPPAASAARPAPPQPGRLRSTDLPTRRHAAPHGSRPPCSARIWTPRTSSWSRARRDAFDGWPVAPCLCCCWRCRRSITGAMRSPRHRR